MHSARLSCFLVVTCSVLALSDAARADVLYLKDLENSAAQNGAGLEVARARIAQGNAQIDRAHAGYMPTLTAGINASLAPGRELEETAPGTGKFVSYARTIDDGRAFTPQPRYGLSLGLKGNLYDFGRTSAAVDAARAQRRVAESEARAGEQTRLLQVRGAYVRWSAAFALAKIADENARAAAEREQRTNGLIEEGVRPTADRTSAAQETAVARLESERAAEELSAARLDLAYVASRDIPDGVEPDPALLDISPAEALPDMPQGKSGEALESARAAALSRARVQERAIAPVITFDASTGVQGQSAQIFPVYSVGVGIGAALWDGGSSSAAAAEARAQAAELAARAEEQKAGDAHALARLKAAQEFAARRLALASQALQLADAQVAQLQEGSAVDSATFRAQVSAEAARSRARKEVVLAQAAYVQARFGLLP